jgi:hypothetical protein
MKILGVTGIAVSLAWCPDMRGSLLHCALCIALAHYANGFTASSAVSSRAVFAPQNCVGRSFSTALQAVATEKSIGHSNIITGWQRPSSALHAVATEESTETTDIITDWPALDAAIATGDGENVCSVLNALKESGKASLWDSVTM